MSADQILQANIGNTDSLVSTPEYRTTNNPISQVYSIPKKPMISVILQSSTCIPIPRGHIDIGPELVVANHQPASWTHMQHCLKHWHCVVIYQKQLAALYSNLLLVQCQALIELSPHPCVRSLCDDFSALETTILRLRVRVVNSSSCVNMKVGTKE